MISKCEKKRCENVACEPDFKYATDAQLWVLRAMKKRYVLPDDIILSDLSVEEAFVLIGKFHIPQPFPISTG